MISTDKESLAIGKTPVTGRKLDVGGDIYASDRKVVTDDTGWTIPSYTLASGWSINKLYVRQTGKRVDLFLDLVRSGATIAVSADGNITDTLVFTLPMGLMPSSTATVDRIYAAGMRDGYQPVTARFRLYDGQFYFVGSSNSSAPVSTGTNFLFNAWWYID